MSRDGAQPSEQKQVDSPIPLSSHFRWLSDQYEGPDSHRLAVDAICLVTLCERARAPQIRLAEGVWQIESTDESQVEQQVDSNHTADVTVAQWMPWRKTTMTFSESPEMQLPRPLSPVH